MPFPKCLHVSCDCRVPWDVINHVSDEDELKYLYALASEPGGLFEKLGLNWQASWAQTPPEQANPPQQEQETQEEATQVEQDATQPDE